MKILIVPDVHGWAIDRLASAKIKHNPHINWRCHYVHPRDAGEKRTQDEFRKVINEFNPDIIHFEFYRSCSQLLDAIPELKSKKIILTHHNQRTKALRSYDWFANGVDYLVTHTNKCKRYLVEQCGQLEANIKVINHGIDLDEFYYNDIEPKEKKVGYVGRIVPWKGLKEIARACKELGYKLQIMGKHDKAGYWDEIIQAGYTDIMDFSYFDCPDSQRRMAYNDMTIFVGNSEDWYEEGTMPYLEAMACGVPIVTTPNGVADDIGKDRYNCLITPFKDYDKLKNNIKELMEDSELRKTLRKNAWETIKNMPEEKMAYGYSKLYSELKNDDNDLISIIIPVTFDRIEQLKMSLSKIREQDYKYIETIIIFDEEENKDNIIKLAESEEELRNEYSDLTIKVLFTGNKGYGLAEARNLGAIESIGKYLLFLDSRLMLEEDSINVFLNGAEITKDTNQKKWFFGNKGSNKNTFVENFSFIERKEFFTFGMFCERINAYGGMSQEIRTRWTNQGGTFVYLEDAQAIELMKASKGKERRRNIIDMKFKLYKMYNGINH